MHRTTCAVVLGAAAIAAALGLTGCSEDADRPRETAQTPAPVTEPPTARGPQDAPAAAPLPPSTALTDVMYRLADPAVPGTDKTGLIERATPDDAAAMDRFGQALRDGGYSPLTFEATDLKWADGQPGNVLAFVSVVSANEQAGDFTFPMEFHRADTGWQLTRDTADALLQSGTQPTPTP